MILDFLQAHPWALALGIFFARICDVSLGTIRTILIFRGYRFWSAIIGFFEVLIWILAASQVLKNLNEWYLILGYAAGYATGNIVGMWLESLLAMGSELIRVISENEHIPLARKLREHGYHVTAVSAHTEKERPVEVVLLVEKRRVVPRLLALIEEIDPDAFYTIENIKNVHSGARSTPKSPSLSWQDFLKRK